MQNPFFEVAQTSAQQAFEEGLPIFLTDVARSTPVNATPYLLSYSDFSKAIVRWPERHGLVRELGRVRNRMVENGFEVDALLIGGSFTELGRSAPADIDCLIFYRCTENAASSQLVAIQKSAKANSVDCRLVPLDGDPMVLLKLTSYFTILYSKRKESLELARCLLLIDCRESI